MLQIILMDKQKMIYMATFEVRLTETFVIVARVVLHEVPLFYKVFSPIATSVL